MKAKTIIVFFVVLFVAGTVFAGDNGNGCKLQGIWMVDVQWAAGDGSGNYTLKSFYAFHGNGTGDNDGTIELEYENPWPGSGLLWTINRGVWKKSDGNNYKYTYYVALADEMGTIYGALRHNGTATLQDCNTLYIVEESILVDPVTLDPLIPIISWGVWGGTWTRMTLKEGYQ